MLKNFQYNYWNNKIKSMMNKNQLNNIKEFTDKVTRDSINSVFNRILSLGNIINDINFYPKFTKEKRIRILKQLIMHYENIEEYEKCNILLNFLKKLGINNFDTNRFS